MSAPERDEGFEALLEFLRDERGFDFTGYKRPSLQRRIRKRMQEVRVDDYGTYRTYLESHPDEFGALFDTILINVTAFFRDTSAWDYMRDEIVPRLVDARAPRDAIRVWATGCSTGEEAYSIAMLLVDAVGEHDFRTRVKIYATDVDDDALNVGRHARYTEKQVEAVPEEFRKRFFEPLNGDYLFRGDLRRSVIFGRHDLVQDPPISRIDLLISRNTLMYFDTDTQRRILANFHFALRDDGFLFLGKSEVLVARSPLYAAVDVKRRVFAKVPTAARERLPLRTEDVEPPVPEDTRVLAAIGLDAAPIAQVVVDHSGRLANANVQARALFGLAQRDLGTLLQDLEISYRPVELRSRIEQVYSERHAVTLRDVEWRVGNDDRFFDVQVSPLTAPTGETPGVAVTFTDVTRYHRLQEALQASKRDVETAYEELQATVEELETTNEELQSTNEELETMNEELQSANEELETINDELQQRTDELNDVNSFLEAILASLTAAVIVIDPELRVLAWNEASRELWGVRPDEAIGQHLLNLDIGLPLERLRAPIRSTLGGESPVPIELDAVNRRGRAVRVVLTFAPLSADGSRIRGAIVMIEPELDREPAER